MPVSRPHEKKPHALVTEVSAEESQSLSAALNDMFVVTTLPETLTGVQAETLASVNVLVPFIHSVVGCEEIAMMPQLRLIATRSTGYDHIDLKRAADQGIAVANVPGYGENAVAEYTFALILTLTRKMRLATTQMPQDDSPLAGLRGIDLYGKTLGVIGTGAIGVHVIRIAKGFGMHVLAYDVRQNRQLPEVLGFRYVSLEELLAHADVVTLHAPATPATYHLMKKETFSQMKPGAFLINTARGSLVDVQALAWALDTGRLAGAGLDTLEGEEFLQREEELLQEPGTEAKLKLLVQHHLLQRQSNVVITPHMAFNTEEALRRIQDTTIENVRSFFLGRPQNLVTAS
jgi:D-lactate dehydrogenase